MSWTHAIIDLLLVVYVLDCLFMGLVILMQRSKQEGLGAAFGGGFTESIWGAQTSNVLVKGTVIAAALFFVLSLCLARLYSSENAAARQGSPVQQELALPGAATASTHAAPTTNAAPTPAPVPAAANPPAPTTTSSATPTAVAPSTHQPVAPKK